MFFTNLIDQIEVLLFVGILVVVRLALPIFSPSERTGRLANVRRRLGQFQLPFALLAGLSLLLAPSAVTALLALPWFIFTIWVAGFGLLRGLPRPNTPLEERCIDVGLIYAPIGAVWLVAYSSGIALLGFSPLIILLTAVHFTYISFGALMITGMIGRQLQNESPARRMFRIGALSSLVSPPLIAVGITLSPTLEAISVLMLATGLLINSLVTLVYIIPTLRNPTARALLILSAASLFISMAMALAYSIGRFTNLWQVPIPNMVALHGWINAGVFSITGLIGWRLVMPPTRVDDRQIPFSRLPWRTRIGADFFERTGALDPAKPPPLGIVDSLTDYQRPDFDSDSIAPEVRAFYENTVHHTLRVYPVWERAFAMPSRLYKLLSRHVQQMNLPLKVNQRESHITSVILPINDSIDGRERVRGWVRVYNDTGEAVYVAAYANHRSGDQVYMNIAFPLPGGNLTSILRLDLLPMAEKKQGIRLTSLPIVPGDQGVYYVTPWLPIRLPINETISVYPAGAAYDGFPARFAEAGALTARHEMWLFGLKFLTLHYAITLLR